MRIAAAVAAALALLLAWIIYDLEREVESRFSGEMFSLPSRIYARPLMLRPGSDVPRAGVPERLERLGYRKLDSPEVVTTEFATGPGWLAFGPPQSADRRPGQYAGSAMLRLDERGRVRRIEDSRGRPLPQAEVPAELIAEIHGPYRSRRRLIPLAELPQHLVDAVLVTEDHRFYQHIGIDPLRILGATLANLRAGHIVQGGSTITQQLVKNFYLSPDRTLARKLREAAMALLLELSHEKDEIFEAYLNEIYLGQRGPVAIHGMGEAASHYFGKDVRALSQGESALLAGMIAAPGVFSPFRDADAARERRDLVLGLLHAAGRIGDEELEQAHNEELALHRPPAQGAEAPWFVEYLKKQLAPEFEVERLERDGLVIESTLDAHLQRAAVRALATGLAELERSYAALKRPDAPLQGALIALDPATGDILAHVGGRDFAESQFDRATQALRQPGSVFKPVVALAALSRGDDGMPAFTLASQVEDAELHLDTPDGEWSPVNFDREFRGRVSVRRALEESLNVPTVRVGLAVGPERIVHTAQQLGISTRLRPVPSLALGSFEVTLLEMTRAYAVLAAGGRLAEPRSWRTVSGAEQEPLATWAADTRQVFDAAEVYLVTSALEGAVERGTGRGLRALGLRGALAGKTGTTNDFRDAWFIGYTPDLVAGVWVGFDDAQTLELPASALALPVFARFMREALGPFGAEPFARPSGVESVEVELATGRRAGPGCWGESELFLAGTAPHELCVGPAWELATRPLDWLRRRLSGHPRARRSEREAEQRGDAQGERAPQTRRPNAGAAGEEEGPAPGWHGGVWIGDPNRLSHD